MSDERDATDGLHRVARRLDLEVIRRVHLVPPCGVGWIAVRKIRPPQPLHGVVPRGVDRVLAVERSEESRGRPVPKAKHPVRKEPLLHHVRLIAHQRADDRDVLARAQRIRPADWVPRIVRPDDGIGAQDAFVPCRPGARQRRVATRARIAPGPAIQFDVHERLSVLRPTRARHHLALGRTYFLRPQHVTWEEEGLEGQTDPVKPLRIRFEVVAPVGAGILVTPALHVTQPAAQLKDRDRSTIRCRRCCRAR